jgi:hypothetical protein
MAIFDITIDNPALKRTVIESGSDEQSSESDATEDEAASEPDVEIDVSDSGDGDGGGGGGGGSLLKKLLLVGGLVGLIVAVRKVRRRSRDWETDAPAPIEIDEETDEESATAE